VLGGIRGCSCCFLCQKWLRLSFKVDESAPLEAGGAAADGDGGGGGGALAGGRARRTLRHRAPRQGGASW